jgi:hypothetical protein
MSGQLYRNLSQAENKDEILRGFKNHATFFTPVCPVLHKTPVFIKQQFLQCNKRVFQ